MPGDIKVNDMAESLPSGESESANSPPDPQAQPDPKQKGRLVI